MLLRIVRQLIALQSGELNSLRDSIVDISEFVHDTYLLTFLSEPYTAFADRLDIVLLHMTACCAARGKEVISTLYHRLHHLILFFVHALVNHIPFERGVLVGTIFVNVETYFLTQFLHVGHGTEDSDRTRQRGRLSIDIICAAGDIIATRSSVVTHRYHYLNTVRLDILNSMPNIFTGIRRTTRAIYTQYKGFDIILFANLLEGLYDLLTYNTFACLIRDFSFEIEHRHFVFRFGRRTLHLC